MRIGLGVVAILSMGLLNSRKAYGDQNLPGAWPSRTGSGVHESQTPDANSPSAERRDHAAPASTVPTIRFGSYASAQRDGIQDVKPEVYHLSRPISQINVDVRLSKGIVPEDNSAELFDTERGHADSQPVRSWPAIGYTWEAPGLCTNPLYFEDANLERHGLSFGIVQPAVSAAHFFSHVVALPYLMTNQHPHECVYVLGDYRPGSYAPYAIDRLPITGRAALVEAGVIAGTALIIP